MRKAAKSQPTTAKVDMRVASAILEHRIAEAALQPALGVDDELAENFDTRLTPILRRVSLAERTAYRAFLAAPALNAASMLAKVRYLRAFVKRHGWLASDDDVERFFQSIDVVHGN